MTVRVRPAVPMARPSHRLSPSAIDVRGRTGWLVGALLLAASCAPASAQETADDGPAPGLHEIPLELQSDVSKAIDLGVEHLLSQQSMDGSWLQNLDGYGSGMTGLALYALMKSGLSPEHPAVRRGFAFMERHPPVKTYSRSCVLLAVATRGLEQDEEWIETLTEELIDTQVAEGWAYPANHPDLSNTQYAAMALRAAQAAGAKVPAKVWKRLADAVLDYAEPLEGTTSGLTARGFRYTTNAEHATGSMTGAGVAVLSICLEQMRGRTGPYERALSEGKQWLETHFSVEHNPVPTSESGSMGRLYYYLYGIERVGSLLEIELLGGRPWYQLGAESLVNRQAESGNWGNLSETSFSLLFLSRATGSLGPASGSGAATLAARWSFGEDDPESDVSLRASGRAKTTLWISSFGDDASFKFGSGEDGDGPILVERVEYWRPPFAGEKGDVLIGAVEADPEGEMARRRFALQCDLDGPRMCNVTARVFIEGKSKPLKSKPLRIRVGRTDRAEWDAYATGMDDNLLRLVRVKVSASSEGERPNTKAANVVDRMTGLGWSPLPEDRSPWVEIEVSKKLKTNRIILTHAGGDEPCFTDFEIVLNGRDRDVIKGTMNPDRRVKTTVELPKPVPIGTLRLTFAGGPFEKPPTLAEVELQRVR